ncbi:MAG: acyltransferase family protein [Aeriscardovia sp.]|nr:acyltransferase family protein [Aeriscardovia sp.]
MVKVRNHSIDTLKLSCALLVVLIHCSYPYKADILPITDVAVPLFFCISGYFVCGAKRSITRIKRIFQIFTWSAILYLIKTETFQLVTTHSLWTPSWQSIINFVIFNDVAFSIHLWYLPTYILLIIAYIIDKFSLWRFSLGMIIPLLLVGVYIKYSISDVCPKEIEYYRNAYFCGLPYFLTGALIKNTPPHAPIPYAIKGATNIDNLRTIYNEILPFRKLVTYTCRS